MKLHYAFPAAILGVSILMTSNPLAAETTSPLAEQFMPLANSGHGHFNKRIPEIIEEVEAGVEPQNYKKIMSITSRRQAIKTACQLAGPNDIILIAGKGHETYQEINGVRTDFNDLEIVTEFLKELNK